VSFKPIKILNPLALKPADVQIGEVIGEYAVEVDRLERQNAALEAENVKLKLRIDAEREDFEAHWNQGKRETDATIARLRAALKDLLKCVVQPRQEQAGYSWMMPIIADAKALAEKGE
jgi:hypothetical protein